MTTALFSVDPGPRVHNIKAMGPVLGRDVFQVHQMAKRLNFPGWGVGRGAERKLSTLEVFLLKVAGLANGALPTEALRNATSAAAVYFVSVERDPELRAKPASLIGYQIAGGAWVWLLGHSGLWPSGPPRQGPVMIMIRVSEVLGEVLRACGEDWDNLPSEARPDPVTAMAELTPLQAIERVERDRVALMARKAALDAKLAAHRAKEAAP